MPFANPVRLRSFGLGVAALVLVPIVACDESPTDPGEAAAGISVEGLLAGTDGMAATPGAGLLRLSLDRAAHRWGNSAADVLTGAVEQRRADARALLAAGDTAGAYAAYEQLRDAQAALAIRVFGNRVADEAIRAVRTESGRLARRIEMLSRAGIDVAPSRDWNDAVSGLVTRAEQAGSANDPRLSLLLAMQAAAAFDSSRQALARAGTRTVRGLDELFASIEAVPEEAGPAAALRAERMRALVAADSATARGDTDEAYTELAKARHAETAAVALALGKAGIADYVTSVAEGLTRVRGALEALDRNDAAARRLLRMIDAAASMHARAFTAAEAGRDAEAIDLAAHAADLANGVLRAVARPD